MPSYSHSTYINLSLLVVDISVLEIFLQLGIYNILYIYIHTYIFVVVVCFFLTRYIQIYMYFYLNITFKLILHASLLLHSTFPPPCFSCEVNFIVFLTLSCLYTLLLLLPRPLPSQNLFSLS